MNVEWIFDGIGTEIVSLILGAGIGGFIGFKIGVNRKITKQVQKGGRGTKQTQISGSTQVNHESNNTGVYINKSKIQQKQKAGDNSVQKQKG